MKKLDLLPLLLLLALTLLSQKLHCQCGDLVFSTQSEVNAFSCSGAVSSMTFQDAPGTTDPIVNLVPIWSQGTEVSVLGDLIINNCDELTTLDGLDRIQSIGGDFLVFQNPMLEEINNPTWPFAMTSIGGILEITNNPVLSTFADLDQLTTLGKFICSGNTAMTVLGGFGSLTAIGENVVITSNTNLSVVDAFPLISSVVGSIFVTGNSSLSNCCNSIYDLYVAAGSTSSQVNNNAPGCNSVSEIDEPTSYLLKTQSDVENFRPCTFGVIDLIIDGDGIAEGLITDLFPIYNHGGSDLAISGDLIIRNCSALTTLDGLDRIVSVGGSFKVESNPSMTEINHPDWPFQLTSIGNELRIENNTSLTSHSDLNSLESVGGFIRYYTNTNLVTLAGFDGLTTAGDIDIAFNDALETLPAFSLLSSVGFIGIRWNATLTNINTFPVLETAERVLLSRNSNLLTIDGFNNLSILETEDDYQVSLQIHDNDQLHTISGFNSLASINGLENYDDNSFEILNNSNLNLITAFGSLSAVQGHTVVNANASLGTCCWLAPIIAGTTDNVEVMNNAPGCNSVAEINTPQEFLLSNQSEVSNFSFCEAGVTNLIIDGATEGDDPITNLNAIFFAGLTELSGDLIVRNCSELLTLEGLDGITNVGGDFKVDLNTVLVEINSSGFPFQLASIGGSLEITGNPLLQSHADLNQLSSVGGDLYYAGNNSLTSIGGYSNLTDAANLDIRQNQNLVQLPPFALLNSCERVTIIFNSSLQNIPQFDGLVSGLENLDIGFNNSITTIDGFNNLTAISGNKRLKIGQCQNLQSITGFNALQSISGEGYILEPVLEIKSNPSLVTVSGFHNLTEVIATESDGRAIDVADNASLNTCCWLEPIIAGATGNVVLENNATGCNSEAEIGAACPILVDCPGDFNGDLQVNTQDFLILNSSFSSDPCTDCTADINNDGFVNTSDFLEYNSLFGTDCNLPSPPAINSSGINQSLLAEISKHQANEIHPELLKLIYVMQSDLEFSIVPNPNNGRQFQLDLLNHNNLSQTASLQIHDLTGRLLYQNPSIKLTERMRISTDATLSTGIYLVSLTQGAKMSIGRMSVK